MFNRCTLSLPLALSGLLLFGADQMPVVTRSAVWHPTDTVLDEAHNACKGKGGTDLDSCFAAQMKKAGASPEALRFFQAMDNEAFLTRFVRAGGPDIAYVFYPYRANTLDNCLLVNTSGEWIDLELAPKSIKAELEKTSAYRDITAAHPHATLWPADRGGDATVKPDQSTGDGKRFLAEYSLQDCHACGSLATIWIRYEFDKKRSFAGAHLQIIQKAQP